MARKWHNEDWRKLYTRLEGQWLRLSALARGLASDLIKYADDAGVLLVLRADEDAGKAIAAMVAAQQWEAKIVAKCAVELLSDGYLVTSDHGEVSIRNFVEAQTRRSPGAVKQKRYRDRMNASPPAGGNAASNTNDNARRNDEGNALRDSDRETRRDEIENTPKPPDRPGGGRGSRRKAGAVHPDASTVLDALNVARMRAIPGAEALSPTADNLRHISDRLVGGATLSDCLAVVEVCEAETRQNAESGRWFNPVTPFRSTNFPLKLAAFRGEKPGGKVTPIAVSAPAHGDDFPGPSWMRDLIPADFKAPS